MSKQIISSHPASTGTISCQALFTVAVVKLALLRIGKDIIGMGYLLELVASIWILNR
jgi:hypothetical protein